MDFLPILEATEDIQETIRILRNQPNVRKFMYTDHEISAEEHAAWLRSLVGNVRQQVYVVMGDRPLGLVSLNGINHQHKTADWAFYLDESMQGKGVGSRVEFKLLNLAFDTLEKLNCEVLETNPAVIRLHKKFGFVEEGVRRSQIIKDGLRVSVHLLGITKTEWMARRPSMLRIMARLAQPQPDA